MGEIHDETRPGSSSVPLIPRVDRLDSLMKYLEGKQNPSSWGNLSTIREADRPSISVDCAIRDVQIKGTILDRLNSLENRLFQLCLEIEASNASTSSMANTYEITSSMHPSSTDQSLSFRSPDEQCLTYDNPPPNSFHQALATRFEFLENPINPRTTTSPQLKPLMETRTDKWEVKICDFDQVGNKSKKARRWRWRRMLGC